MITKEIVKEFANTNCPYLAMLSVNEKYMIRTLRNVLDKNPDVLFNFDEETDEKTSIMDKFARNKELLKEAKAVVDGAPKVLKEAASKEDAESIKAKLEEVGAKVTLK